MATIQDGFTVAGLPRNNATAKLWSAGRFDTAPVKGTALPSGTALQTTLTGTSHGYDGAYRFTSVASGDYYVSLEWNGLRVYHHHLVNEGTGLGYINAQHYASLAEAKNATPSGGTLYLPPGDYPVTEDFLLTDKPINIIGSGWGSRIVVGANNIVGLGLVSSAGATTDRVQIGQFSDFSVVNPDNYAGVTLLRLDRSRRNNFYNLHLDGGAAANGAIAIDARSVWINTFFGIHINNCGLGFDTRNQYVTDGGPTTSCNFYGGRIENSTSGMILLNCSMMTVDMTIEGCTTVGVFASGGNKITLTGYREANGYDAWLDGLWRDYTLIRHEKIELANIGAVCRIESFRDTSAGFLNVGANCGGITVIEPWWGESPSSPSEALTDIYDAWRQGRLTVVGSNGEPKAFTQPKDTVGVYNLLGNPNFDNSAAGWTLSNLSATGSVVPFGTVRSLLTTSAVSGTAFSALRTMDAPFTNDLCGQLVTLTCDVNVPDSTWRTLQLTLQDGNRNAAKTIHNGAKVGAWRTVSASIRVGDSATQLAFKLSGFIGVSGMAYIANPVLAIGNNSSGPHIRPDFRGAESHYQRVLYRTLTAMASGDQIDPSLGGKQYVEGTGGATVVSGQATISNSSTWLDGQILELVGTSTTNNVTFVSGSTQKLALGAATRQLKATGRLVLEYSLLHGLWLEKSWSNGGFNT